MDLLGVLLMLFAATHLATSLTDQDSTTQQGGHIAAASTVSMTTDNDVLSADDIESRTKDADASGPSSVAPNSFNFNSSISAWPTVSAKPRTNLTSAIDVFLVESDPAEGESMTFSCIVLDPSILTVSWYKNDRLTTHDMLATTADSQRMSIAHDIRDDTRRVFNLTIDFLRTTDSGRYTCRGINRPDSAASLDVSVRYVPELHYPECFMNGKRQMIVMEGDELRFECRLQMDSLPWHLIWFRQLNKSASIISAPMRERSGMIVSEHTLVASQDLNGAKFSCSVVCLYTDCYDSSEGSPRSCNIGPLIVEPLEPLISEPIISINPLIQIASEGDDVDFSCSTSLADGNAVWFPVGDEPPDDHIVVSNDGSQMSIKNVRDNDTEVMACGVFCQDKLIKVEHVNMQVIHHGQSSPAPTPTTRTSTRLTNFISTTITTLTGRTTLSNRSAGGTSKILNRVGSKESKLIGALVGVFMVIIVIIVVVVKCRKRKYERAPVNEPQSGKVQHVTV